MRGEEEEAELEEEEEGRRCTEGLVEGECSSVPPPLRFFTNPCWSKPRPPLCLCIAESPSPPLLWELLAVVGGSRGDEWLRGACVCL